MYPIKLYELPKHLIPFKHFIDQTTKESVKLTFSNDLPFAINSKIGGTPYTDTYAEIPKDRFGQTMQLLIQINFSEFNLSEPFPASGLLQIFVNKDFGKSDMKKDMDYFSIKFSHLPATTDRPMEFSKEQEVQKYFPIQKQLKIVGKPSLEPVSALDYRHGQCYPPDMLQQVTEDERTFEEIYFETFLGAEHKIGGYPYFIENDFRLADTKLKIYDTLLLQLVTDDAHFINYRDSGIISFFIESEQLAKLNFSNVYMHVEEY